ncbi:hypothetical protein [Brevifollis gellanilyticus]|uniref:hypothetical protein n=1 Tax=Brevifollis gellanilyticus TaxID=748831 RepID=UPI0011BD608E|nr:hypothetical protein [Brevifollis gellanilyticus]
MAAILGYFDRNPPLYYEMRHQRMEKESMSASDNLSLYDDGGVAADRLGKSDLAIQWMQRKKIRMQLQGDKATKEDRYRYYANLGTFHAHKWVKQPEPFRDRAELQKAIEAINAALQVNPEGHFSREIYQMVLLDWFNDQSDNPDAPGSQWPLGRFFGMADAMEKALNRKQDILGRCEGLAGLVTLGAAWQSPDVFILITNGLHTVGKYGIAELASLRAQEILATGRKPFYPVMPVDPEEWTTDKGVRTPEGLMRRKNEVLSEQDRLKTRQFFESARKAVESRQSQRTSFMMSKLEKGQHPDTHADFWSGWAEPAIPQYPD